MCLLAHSLGEALRLYKNLNFKLNNKIDGRLDTKMY